MIRWEWSFQGQKNTLPVTMDHMIYHCQAVARGVEAATGRAMIVGDLPFMSYQSGLDEAMRNAGLLLKEGQAEAVKLEGGAEYAELVSRLVRVGIPVMGHWTDAAVAACAWWLQSPKVAKMRRRGD